GSSMTSETTKADKIHAGDYIVANNLVPKTHLDLLAGYRGRCRRVFRPNGFTENEWLEVDEIEGYYPALWFYRERPFVPASRPLRPLPEGELQEPFAVAAVILMERLSHLGLLPKDMSADIAISVVAGFLREAPDPLTGITKD